MLPDKSPSKTRVTIETWVTPRIVTRGVMHLWEHIGAPMELQWDHKMGKTNSLLESLR